jgi:predicted metal-dependent hydrolase
VKDFLKKVLRDECEKRALEHATMLGRTITRVTVSKANSRWGSCSTKGALSFNWLLVFAPVQILDYIIAHEVAHLKEMNHSSRFWQLVEKIHPAMKSARKWLHKEGHKLHRYE